MNKKRIIALADHIEKLNSYEFNMNYYFFRIGSDANTCSTPACIAGHAINEFATIIDRKELEDVSPRIIAQRILGIEYDQAVQLFSPQMINEDNPDGSWKLYQPNTVSPIGAAVVLRNFADTGKVDWMVAKEYMTVKEGGYPE